MNIMELGALGEFLSSILVLVTLIYLSLQVRQAKNQMILSSQTNRAVIGQELMSSISDSPYMAPVFEKLGGWAWTDVGLEDVQDTIRFNAWSFAWWRTEELNFRTYSPEQLSTQQHLIRTWLAAWGTPWWPSNKAIFDADFVAMVDNIYAELMASEVPQETLQSTR